MNAWLERVEAGFGLSRIMKESAADIKSLNVPYPVSASAAQSVEAERLCYPCMALASENLLSNVEVLG